MKIIELNLVEFGALREKKLYFDSGINIIEGDNEAGKSTVMTFIKFMLWGLSKRGHKGADKENALSWENHRAAGTMTLEFGRSTYRIERTAHGAGTRISESVRVIDLSTGTEILTPPDEFFLSVPCDVFESSCAIAQMRTSEINKEKTSGAIENMLASADESIDILAILEKIDAVRKEYRLNKGEGGILYNTATEINALKLRRRAAEEKYLQYNDTKERLEKSEAELADAAKDISRAEDRRRMLQNAMVLKRFDDLDTLCAQAEHLEKKIACLEAEVSATDFVPDVNHVLGLGSRLESYKQRKNTHLERLEECDRLQRLALSQSDECKLGKEIESAGGADAISGAMSRYKTGAAIGFIGAAVAFVTAVIGLLFVNVIFAGVAALASVVCLIVGIIQARKMSAICKKYSKKARELGAYLRDCAEQYRQSVLRSELALEARAAEALANDDRVRDFEALVKILAMTRDVSDVNEESCVRIAGEERTRLEEFCLEVGECRQKLHTARQMIERDRGVLSSYDEKALREKVTVDVTTVNAQALARAEYEEKFSRERYSKLEIKFRNMRDLFVTSGARLDMTPVEVSDKIAELEEEYRRESFYFDALMLAKETIEKASAAMSGNVTPAIAAKAGELMSAITQSRHSSILANKNLDLSVEQDGFFVSVDNMSGGTRDAAYICLRIALMLRIYGDNVPPLMMDESLCQLDNNRTRRMLSMLGKMSDTVDQIIIFTCHTRERELCKSEGIAVNGIRI